VLGEPLVPEGLEGEDAFWASQRNQVRFWHGLGYDFYCVRGAYDWPSLRRARTADTAELSKGERAWVQQEGGVITRPEEFDEYPWPGPASQNMFDFVPQLQGELPDGMGLTWRLSGILENTMWLMGYEGISFALMDEPELVRKVVRKVADRAAELFSAALKHPEIRAVVLGEDMGFKTQTMLPPDVMREFIFPQQKRLVDMAHEKGVPFVLHSCGKLEAIMDDLIGFVGIDAKHSFEDVIETVVEAKAKYGERIAVLGGIDVDKLARYDEADLRAYVRDTIQGAAPKGGYALGSGNSVANYVKVSNFLAMLEEGRTHGRYPLRGK